MPHTFLSPTFPFLLSLSLISGCAPLATQPPSSEVNTDELMANFVNIPAGSFIMGSDDGYSNERPVHRVEVSSFRMMTHEVTFSLWDACVASGGCSNHAEDGGWGRGSRPVINVSWDEVTQEFIPWLGEKLGKSFRLPTEAEWEYAARAGSQENYSWGDEAGHNQANCQDCGSRWDYRGTAPVKSFASNPFGLYDMHGNVWEWVQDCANKNYEGAPTDAHAWAEGDCSRRMIRGGSWHVSPRALRASYRLGFTTSKRMESLGFRLVLEP